MKINDSTQILKLVGCNILIFFLLVFFGKLLAAIFVYFKVGSFLFCVKEVFFISLKRGLVIGLTFGLGLWIKAKIQERKARKRN